MAETFDTLIGGRKDGHDLVAHTVVRLLGAVNAPLVQPCVKGKFFDRMQAKLDQLTAHRSNELVTIDLRAMADALADSIEPGAVSSTATRGDRPGVTREFIVKGINAGKLEFREGSVHGNPYLRLLRSQLEAFVASEYGPEFLQSKKTKTELRAINKEITLLKNKLTELEERKSVLESRSHSK